MRRTLMLLQAFFTGVVNALPQEIVDKRRENWAKLSEKGRILHVDKLKEKLAARRASMDGTAARSNTLGVIDAFALAFAGLLLLAPDTKSAVKWVVCIGVVLILVSACIHRMAIASKLKVWKRPRKGGFSEPDEMLQWAVDAEENVATSSEVSVAELNEMSQKLHARKIILVVERRAQNAAIHLANAGTWLIIASLLLRLVL